MLQIAIVFFLIMFIIGFLGGIIGGKTLLPPLDRRDKEGIRNPSLLDMMLVLGVCLIVFAFCLMLIAMLLACF